MAPTRLLLIVLLCCGAAFGGYLALGSGMPESTVWADHELEAEEEAEAQLAGEMAAGGEGEEAAEDGGETGGGEERQSLAQTGSVRTPVVLRVLDGTAKNTVVPGATVRFLEFEGRRGPFGSRGFGRGYDSRNQPHYALAALDKGLRFKTDAGGKVQLPGPQRFAVAVCAHQDKFGFVHVRRSKRPTLDLVLRPDQSLKIRVVDRQDRPVANAPVALLQIVSQRDRSQVLRTQLVDFRRQMEVVSRRNPAQAELMMRDMEIQLSRLQQVEYGRLRNGRVEAVARKTTLRHRLIARRTTDAQGLVHIRHAQLYQRSRQKWWPRNQGRTFEVALQVPLAEPVRQQVQGPLSDDEELELVMPATGRVALRLVDFAGDPFVHPAMAELQVMSGDQASWLRLGVRKEQDQGLIEFPMVGLGVQLRPRLRLDDNDFRWEGESFTGPTTAGQRVVHEVTVSSNFGMLHGRLVDPAGKPLAGVTGVFSVHGKAGRLEGEDLVTGPDGRFQMMFKIGRHKAPYSLEVRRRFPPPKPGVPATLRPPEGLWMPLQELGHGRRMELGDLVIAPLPTLFEGVVRDDRGQPVRGARVQLQRQRDMGRSKVQLRFRDETFVQTRSDAEGRYALFGSISPGVFRLAVRARNHRRLETEPLSLESRRDLDLVRSSDLRGSLVAPAWLNPRLLRISASRAGDKKQQRRSSVRRRRGETSFSFGNLESGYWDVAVFLDRFPEPILRVPGVLLEPGQRQLHPNLSKLDLRPLLQRFVFTAQTAAGQSLANPGSPLICEVQQPGGKRSFIGFPWRKGKVEVISAAPQMTVVQVAAGYQMEKHQVAAGETTLVFRPVPALTLELPGLKAALAEVSSVRISVVLQGQTGLPQGMRFRDAGSGRSHSYSRAQLGKSGGAWLREQPEVQIPLMLPGKYQVIARLRGGGFREVNLILGVVELKFESGGNRHRLAVPAAQLQQALATYRTRKAKAEQQRQQRAQQRANRQRGR